MILIPETEHDMRREGTLEGLRRGGPGGAVARKKTSL